MAIYVALSFSDSLKGVFSRSLSASPPESSIISRCCFIFTMQQLLQVEATLTVEP